MLNLRDIAHWHQCFMSASEEVTSMKNQLIFRKSLLILGPLVLAVSSYFCVTAQQPSAFDDLERYLNQKMVGPEAVRVIKRRLNERAPNTPLDTLVMWAKAGFRDLHDEHGIWKTESISLKLGVVHAIWYYFSTSPPADNSTRYLTMLDELQGDDYISFHLLQATHLFVDEPVLEGKVFQLLQDKNPKLRADGVLMGGTLAEQKRALFDSYQQMLKSDDDAHVRTTILSSIIGWRRRDVAFVAFDRLLNDSDPRVRDWAARGLKGAADRGVLTTNDLVTILPVILKTNEPFVRISIGRTAARLSTDRSLYIRGDKITDELLYRFINIVRAKGTRAGSALSDADLAKEWLAWWTPLIPEYTVRPRLVH